MIYLEFIEALMKIVAISISISCIEILAENLHNEVKYIQPAEKYIRTAGEWLFISNNTHAGYIIRFTRTYTLWNKICNPITAGQRQFKNLAGNDWKFWTWV